MTGFAKLNRPWLHFMVLGLVFYAVQATLLPAPKTVVGPLSAGQVSALQTQWETSTGSQPTPKQLQGLVNVALDQAMLLQHALALNFHLYDGIVYQRLIRNMDFLQLSEGQSEAERFDQAIALQMHLDDEVVKRRLIQLVEQQLALARPALVPTADEISAEFERRQAVLVQPPTYSFEHVFFGPARAPAVAVIAASILDAGLDVEAARALGAPFLQGHQFLGQTPDQLQRNFGHDFVAGLEQAQREAAATVNPNAGYWLGPIASAYGLHLVWLTNHEAARNLRLPEVAGQLRHDLGYAAQKRSLACAIAALRKGYIVQGWTPQAPAANHPAGCS